MEVCIMYEKVSTNLNFVEREKSIQKFWEENAIFEKSIDSRKEGESYTFYDGPPTANGKPHIGHVLTRVIKDMIPRYRTMKGYQVPRKAGWDTHGLPVELEVEKMLGLDGKEQIEKYGSMEKYREYLATGFNNEKAVTDLLKWYGSKEKAMEAILQSVPDKEEVSQQKNENEEIYKQLMNAKNTEDAVLEKDAISKLAELYKKMFNLDNARAILLDLAKEYTEYEKFAETTDNQYGKGCAEYTAQAIRRYYGEL
jgi:leucyl-tRNA synthetase